MIDGDVGLNNLDVVMGMENRVIYDMADVIDNKWGHNYLSRHIILLPEHYKVILLENNKKFCLVKTFIVRPFPIWFPE